MEKLLPPLTAIIALLGIGLTGPAMAKGKVASKAPFKICIGARKSKVLNTKSVINNIKQNPDHGVSKRVKKFSSAPIVPLINGHAYINVRSTDSKEHKVIRSYGYWPKNYKGTEKLSYPKNKNLKINFEYDQQIKDHRAKYFNQTEHCIDAFHTDVHRLDKLVKKYKDDFGGYGFLNNCTHFAKNVFSKFTGIQLGFINGTPGSLAKALKQANLDQARARYESKSLQSSGLYDAINQIPPSAL